jgi:hypothetical protein
VIKCVSPEFAMTKMDEESHPECDLYVEDLRAKHFLNELLVAKARDVVKRCLSRPTELPRLERRLES